MSLVKISQAELEELNKTRNELSALPSKRVRKQAKHKDADFLDSMALQKLDAGKTGGLIKGSGYHYDRGYNGWN